MFRRRRAAAYRAYYEHMPLRPAARPRGPDMRLYRRYEFGDLLTLNMLDTRQYRTEQPCGDNKQPRCDASVAPNATMLGFVQERWLRDGLSRDRAVWSVLGQQIPLMQREIHRRGEILFDMDKWDGYVAARNRLLGHVADIGKGNLIVLSGDVHAAWVGDLKSDFDRPGAPVIGTEFIGTSISSKGDGWDSKKSHRRTIDRNPHMRFYNGRRGYTRCEVSPGQWRTDYRTVPYVTRPGAPISTKASFIVERAKPGVAIA